jgi:hypothetical protein
VEGAAGGVYDEKAHLFPLCHQVRDEVDLISVFVYLLVVRAVRYARLVPGWGPILMAVVSTVTDSAVLLYACVLMVLQFSIGVAHSVAFSSDNAYFSSVLNSFYNLFAMSTCTPLARLSSLRSAHVKLCSVLQIFRNSFKSFRRHLRASSQLCISSCGRCCRSSSAIS